MTRNGISIKEHSISGGVNAHINYSMVFGEYEAAHEAGLDLWKWEEGEYPTWFKAKIMAWYNLHNLVRIHGEDAQNRAAKKASKR